MKEFIPLALTLLPSLLALPIMVLATFDKIPLRFGALLVAFPIAISGFLYLYYLHQPWYAAGGFFLGVLAACEYGLYTSHKYVSEMGMHSSQFDLITDIKLKR